MTELTSPFPLSGKGTVRWRVALPGRRVNAMSVAADGMCFVATEGGVVALDGAETRWSAATDSGCVLLDDGLLVTARADGYMVREQRTGAVVSTIEATPRWPPMPLAGGQLVFLTSGHVLCATTLTGETRWETTVRPMPALLVWHDTVFVAERTVVRAFDRDDGPMWRVELGGELAGWLVGLPDGNVLVPVHGEDHTGFLVLDPGGDTRRVPAHLPPDGVVVPLSEDLLVLPGWSERDDVGEWRPTVIVWTVAPEPWSSTTACAPTCAASPSAPMGWSPSRAARPGSTARTSRGGTRQPQLTHQRRLSAVRLSRTVGRAGLIPVCTTHGG
jgi:hypothetical protein